MPTLKDLGFDETKDDKRKDTTANKNVFFTYSKWESELFLDKYKQSDVFKNAVILTVIGRTIIS